MRSSTVACWTAAPIGLAHPPPPTCPRRGCLRSSGKNGLPSTSSLLPAAALTKSLRIVSLSRSTMSDPVDVKPAVEEKCKVTKCSALLAEYEACATRVKTGQVHHEGANCTGQYFDLYACVDKCAQKAIFAQIR